MPETAQETQTLDARLKDAGFHIHGLIKELPHMAENFSRLAIDQARGYFLDVTVVPVRFAFNKEVTILTGTNKEQNSWVEASHIVYAKLSAEGQRKIGTPEGGINMGLFVYFRNDDGELINFNLYPTKPVRF